MVWKDTDSTDAGGQLPLSRVQKRDLIQILAAGVISTGLVLAIFMVPRRPAPRLDGEGVRAARDPRPPVAVVAQDVLAPVSQPALSRPAAARASRPAARRPQARPDQTTAAPRRNRLVRLVVGDGRYTVSPFPRVPPLER